MWAAPFFYVIPERERVPNRVKKCQVDLACLRAHAPAREATVVSASDVPGMGKGGLIRSSIWRRSEMERAEIVHVRTYRTRLRAHAPARTREVRGVVTCHWPGARAKEKRRPETGQHTTLHIWAACGIVRSGQTVGGSILELFTAACKVCGAACSFVFSDLEGVVQSRGQ